MRLRITVKSDLIFVISEDAQASGLVDETEEVQSSELQGLRDQIQHLQDTIDGKDSRMYEPYPEELDDTALWTDWKIRLRHRVNVARVVVLNDIHFPDESVQAIQLALRIITEVQPHVILFGGDAFDFDALGKFMTHHRRIRRDAIKEVESRWYRFNDEIDSVLKKPSATARVLFKGQHDNRVEAWNSATNNPMAQTSEEAFVNMVRADGRVMWLGEASETNIGKWRIQHGERYGENASKNAMKDDGYGANLTQGNSHRPDMTIIRQNDPEDSDLYRVLMSAVTGCLCNIPPHYNQSSKASRWINGVLVGHVMSDDGYVNLQNIVFHRKRNGSMWTSYGNRVFEQA